MIINFFKALGILILVSVGLELGLRLFFPPDYLEIVMSPMIKEHLKSQSNFYRETFCDPTHQTALGERRLSQCLDKSIHPLLSELAKKKKIAWAFGGSTTYGHECESNTNWPQQLGLLFPSLTLVTFAKEDLGYRDAYLWVEDSLKKQEPPAALFWAKSMTNLEGFVGKGIFSTTLLRFDVTMSLHSYLYKWIRLATRRMADSLRPVNADPNQKSPLIEMTTHQALIDQEYYTRKVFALSQQYKFQMICMRMPNVEGITKEVPFISGPEFDDLLRKIGEKTKAICEELNIPYVDVQSCYANWSQAQ